MKRFLAAILAAILQFLGIALPNVTMPKLVAANSLQTLLCNYSSVHEVITSDYIGNMEWYYTRDLQFTDNTGAQNADCLKDQYTLITRNADYSVSNLPGREGVLYVDWYAMSRKEADQYRQLPTSHKMLIPESLAGLQITGTEKIDGKTMRVVARVQSETPFTLADGVPEDWVCRSIEYRFTLLRKTLAIVSYDAVLHLDDGGEAVYYTVTMEYNSKKAAPEALCMMQEQIAAIGKDKEKTAYIFSVVYDYGTRAEKTYSFKTDSSCVVNIIPKEGYELSGDSVSAEDYIPDENGNLTLTFYAQKTAE